MQQIIFGPNRTLSGVWFAAMRYSLKLAFAAGIEHARLAFFRDGKTPEESIYEGQVACLKEWGDYDYNEGNNKNLGSILLAIEEYFRHHGFATDPVQPFMFEEGETRKPAVECRQKSSEVLSRA